MINKHEATVSTWKYATSHGVDGAPFGFVDNQRLAAVPQKVDDWLVLLTPLAFNKGIIRDAGSPVVVKSLDQRQSEIKQKVDYGVSSTYTTIKETKYSNQYINRSTLESGY
jgi:hypothetical protein